jgi:hypothetical protein
MKETKDQKLVFQTVIFTILWISVAAALYFLCKI